MPPIGVDLTPSNRPWPARSASSPASASARTLPATSPGGDDDDGAMSSTRGACGGTRSKASDVCASTSTPTCIEGRWDVTPAIHIHTELHQRRRDARVVVHNHPYYVDGAGSDWRAPRDRPPDRVDVRRRPRFVDEYDGEVDDAELGADLAEPHRRRVGGRPRQPRRDRHRADDRGGASTGPRSVDRMCRLAYDSMLLGKPTTPIAPGHQEGDEGVAARARPPTSTGTAPCACC